MKGVIFTSEILWTFTSLFVSHSTISAHLCFILNIKIGFLKLCLLVNSLKNYLLVKFS